jgi:hypothetical protein
VTGLGDLVAPLLACPQPASLEAVVTVVINGMAGCQIGERWCWTTTT